MGAASCDLCAHYVYDEEDDFSECMVNMDEDDYARFITSSYESCPYFQLDDEYKVVRKQMLACLLIFLFIMIIPIF